MEIKLEYSAQKIIDTEFKPLKNGYDPVAVDKMLDKVANDYFAMQDYVKHASEEINELRSTNKVYKKKIDELEVQNEIFKEKLNGITEDDAVSYSNLEYIKRINALESALHKAGIDPTTIK